MADLTITAANVAPGLTASYDTTRKAGATITQGQTVYLDPVTLTYKLTDADSATVAARVCNGVAVSAASSGQPIVVQTGGPLTIGATVVVGGLYVASATAGGICPVADLTTGAWPTVLGWATTAAIIQLNLNAAGVAKP